MGRPRGLWAQSGRGSREKQTFPTPALESAGSAAAPEAGGRGGGRGGGSFRSFPGKAELSWDPGHAGLSPCLSPRALRGSSARPSGFFSLLRLACCCAEHTCWALVSQLSGFSILIHLKTFHSSPYGFPFPADVFKFVSYFRKTQNLQPVPDHRGAQGVCRFVSVTRCLLGRCGAAPFAPAHPPRSRHFRNRSHERLGLGGGFLPPENRLPLPHILGEVAFTECQGSGGPWGPWPTAFALTVRGQNYFRPPCPRVQPFCVSAQRIED